MTSTNPVDPSGRDESGDSSGRDESGDSSGRDESGDSSGCDESGDSSGRDESGDPSGRDESGDSSGRDESDGIAALQTESGGVAALQATAGAKVQRHVSEHNLVVPPEDQQLSTGYGLCQALMTEGLSPAENSALDTVLHRISKTQAVHAEDVVHQVPCHPRTSHPHPSMLGGHISGIF